MRKLYKTLKSDRREEWNICCSVVSVLGICIWYRYYSTGGYRQEVEQKEQKLCWSKYPKACLMLAWNIQSPQPHLAFLKNEAFTGVSYICIGWMEVYFYRTLGSWGITLHKFYSSQAVSYIYTVLLPHFAKMHKISIRWSHLGFRATQKTVSAITCSLSIWNIIPCQYIWLGTIEIRAIAPMDDDSLAVMCLKNNCLLLVWIDKKYHPVSVTGPTTDFKKREVKIPVLIFLSSHMIEKIPLCHSPTMWRQESSVSHVVSSVLLLNTDS